MMLLMELVVSKNVEVTIRAIVSIPSEKMSEYEKQREEATAGEIVNG